MNIIIYNIVVYLTFATVIFALHVSALLVHHNVLILKVERTYSSSCCIRHVIKLANLRLGFN